MGIVEKTAKQAAAVKRAASDRAGLLAELTKLEVEARICENTAKENYLALGKLYYEKSKDNPDPEFEKLCMSIRNAESGAEEIRGQIQNLKKKRR